MLKLSLEALQVVDAIDRAGSFARAGQELHKSASTISYIVGKLEEDIRVQVFERNGPRIGLTPAGMELLKEGRALLHAAEALEHRARRVQSGWETELTIAMDGMFTPAQLQQEIAGFYAIGQQTRLRFQSETLSGTWEALLDGRADLLVGAAGEGPAGGGYVARLLGEMRFVFAVAPGHPLASVEGPLTREHLQQHRAIVVGDSARNAAPRTVGLLLGQDTLTVATMAMKLAFQLSGAGFGFLPEHLARGPIENGLLVEKDVEQGRSTEPFFLAWRSGESGAGLAWWREHLLQGQLWERLLTPKIP
jgi:DNA-binding transcriptional LysR family regulator